MAWAGRCAGKENKIGRCLIMDQCNSFRFDINGLSRLLCGQRKKMIRSKFGPQESGPNLVWPILGRAWDQVTASARAATRVLAGSGFHCGCSLILSSFPSPRRSAGPVNFRLTSWSRILTRTPRTASMCWYTVYIHCMYYYDAIRVVSCTVTSLVVPCM
jgi:hypothetical protein